MVALTSHSDLKAGFSRCLMSPLSTGYHRGHLWFCDFLRGLVFQKSSGFVGKAMFVKFGLVQWNPQSLTYIEPSCFVY